MIQPTTLERIEKLAKEVRQALLEGRGVQVPNIVLGKKWPIQDLMLAIVLASDDTMATAFKGAAKSLFAGSQSEAFAYQHCLEVEIINRNLPAKERLYQVQDLTQRNQLAIVALMAWDAKTRAELKPLLMLAVESPVNQGWECENVGS